MGKGRGDYVMGEGKGRWKGGRAEERPRIFLRVRCSPKRTKRKEQKKKKAKLPSSAARHANTHSRVTNLTSRHPPPAHPHAHQRHGWKETRTPYNVKMSQTLITPMRESTKFQ